MIEAKVGQVPYFAKVQVVEVNYISGIINFSSITCFIGKRTKLGMPENFCLNCPVLYLKAISLSAIALTDGILSTEDLGTMDQEKVVSARDRTQIICLEGSFNDLYTKIPSKHCTKNSIPSGV